MDVTLQLDRFSHSALLGFVVGPGGSTTRTLRAASLHYLADRDTVRAAWRVPRFVCEARGIPVRVSLDDEPWQALSLEAARQGVSANSLARHALMYFLADVDQGRASMVTASATRST
jgi:hypothetical protein